MSTSEPTTAAEKPEAEAAAPKTADAGAQDQAKKDRPRRRRGNKKGEDGKNGQPEQRYQQKGQQDTDNAAGAPEKKPKQQYRQKGEPKEGAGGNEAQPEAAGDAKAGESADT